MPFEQDSIAFRIARFLFKAVAVIVIIAFVSVYLVNSLLSSMDSPLFGLLPESQELKGSISSDAQSAIVYISAVNENKDELWLEQSAGTGFNIDTNGLIITNNHVIENAKSITVTFPDGTLYRADSWHGTEKYDLAALKLADASGLPALILADYTPAQGETVHVIGNPLNYANFAVSGTFVDYMNIMNIDSPVFAFDMPIYSGNSGSPVFNSMEQVIAVVNGTVDISAYSGKEQTLATAIPAANVLNFLNEYPPEQTK